MRIYLQEEKSILLIAQKHKSICQNVKVRLRSYASMLKLSWEITMKPNAIMLDFGLQLNYKAERPVN